MRKLLFALPVAAAFFGSSTIVATEPAMAFPNCETLVLLRCEGHNVNGQYPPITGYDSVEECVAAETPARCPTQFSATDTGNDWIAKFEHPVTGATARS